MADQTDKVFGEEGDLQYKGVLKNTFATPQAELVKHGSIRRLLAQSLQSQNFTVTNGWELSSSGNAVFSQHRKDRVLKRVKNTSGGALAAGDAVVLKAVAAGDEVTTTTTQGDDLIYGMITGAVADGAYIDILQEGKTTVLKVDGTTDIAIGDLLGTFTTAKIAMKAASGDMAFAMALEAYTTDDSNGVIDALLITPRKV